MEILVKNHHTKSFILLINVITYLIINYCFFHRDHQEGYEIHLNKKYGAKDSSRKPVKMIENMFTSVETALKDKVA